MIFDLLQRCNHKGLTNEASAYLTLAVYSVFRQLYTANPKSPAALFSVPGYLFQPAVTGELARTAAAIGELASGRDAAGDKGMDPSKAPLLVPDDITRDYPLFASSLFNLLRNAETRLQ